ncbi:hypothetical protein RchiOBHm_Chr4g0409621 [Rosa chinensis]|uniref:Uncharacterized protein n=1 Tax=Rosa chinensis TaxID=74649 RepID=A0A2P6QV53_ROSCH|nr:hypothetical protein RchiOBHm_Chr4g0409621 [Rosa chinensis]
MTSFASDFKANPVHIQGSSETPSRRASTSLTDPQEVEVAELARNSPVEL